MQANLLISNCIEFLYVLVGPPLNAGEKKNHFENCGN